jgi:hypothetical protein
MRTSTAAVLMVVALGAMTTAVMWARAQAEYDNAPVVLSPTAEHKPGPGWLHGAEKR